MTLKGKLISSAEAKPTNRQHKTPCSDCPFRRDSLPGWLGGYEPDQYAQLAHSDERIDCHTKIGPQCAGAAIYRENVCKSPRDKSVLLLPQNKEKVFGRMQEFLEHHKAE
jgi:hypothetical protein